MPSNLRTLCIVTAILCNVHESLGHEIPRRSFLSRRAIDGTRGRKYFDPDEEGTFDSYGSAGGQYEPYEDTTDFSDIRRNVPGEPGIDYPAYTTLPQTGFTCEGRSRGYYADEAAGCQVFHVCHDVLVSSFLCPMGSIFSQKLLTCDWWTKVDCSTTQKYIGVNRNGYQPDDDEMIRNAYAMISLHSGKDVTKDGLVDPDRTGSIVDYQHGSGRINDYSTPEAAGNDIRNGFDDYLNAGVRQFLPNYNQYSNHRKQETAKGYQEKFYPGEKSKSPYHDSPIIRIQKIDRRVPGDQRGKNDFQDDYRRQEYSNQFQPSYAPTVPTVTTTTRRFYSPTVPTTYRPSTLAYNKLDQVVDSSDHLYSQSKDKSFVTPPTRVFPTGGSTGRHLPNEGFKRARAGSRDFVKNEENYYEDSFEDDESGNVRDSQGDARRNFRITVPEFNLNRSGTHGRQSSDGSYGRFEQERADEGESEEYFETGGSIGLGHALREPFRGISVQEQDLVDGKLKTENKSLVLDFRLTNASDESSKTRKDDAGEYQHTLVKPDSVVPLKDEEDATAQYEREADATTTEDYESKEFFIHRDSGTSPAPYDESTEREVTDDAEIYVPSTTSASIESTVDATTKAFSLQDSADNPTAEESRESKVNSSVDPASGSLGKDSIARMDLGPPLLKPAEVLKPPEVDRFRINVPDTLLARYSTIDNRPYPQVRTTELPPFEHSSGNEDFTKLDAEAGVTPSDDYQDEKAPAPAGFTGFTATKENSVSSTVRLYSTSWVDQSTISAPATDIAPPLIDYPDGLEDLTSQGDIGLGGLQKQEDHSIFPALKNDSEVEILRQYNEDLRFTIRDAVRDRSQSRNLCSGSQRSGESCSTSTDKDEISVFTPSPTQSTFERTVTASTASPSAIQFTESTDSPIKFAESVTSRSVFTSVKSSLSGKAQSAEPLESTSRPVTQTGDEPSIKSTKGDNQQERSVDSSTANSLFRSIHPETLKEIEETIEQSNRPYQVSFTVREDEDLALNGGDLISRLIAQHGQKSSILPDKLNDFEVIKSVEPEVETVSDTIPASLNKTTVTRERLTSESETNQNASALEPPNADEATKADKNVNTVSLLQLMAELLKLDRFPRPFATVDRAFDTQSHASAYASSDTTSKSLLERLQPRTVSVTNFRTDYQKFDERASTVPEESATSSVTRTSPQSKEQLLEQLTQSFGQPLYQTQPTFQLPDAQRTVDFQTGLPLGVPSKFDDLNRLRSTLSTDTSTVRVTSKFSTSSTSIPTTSTVKTPAQTEKTVVKTEFVPSIGFSFDTNEGREEYVEAVLGGLIDEHRAKSEEKESASRVTDSALSRNDSLRRI